MIGPGLSEVLQLMTQAPDRARWLDAELRVAVEERGGLLADRRARASVVANTSGLVGPPRRTYRPARTTHRVSVRDGRIGAAPEAAPANPAAGELASDLVYRLLRPWHLLSSHAFEPSIIAGEVAGRPCHVLAAHALGAGPFGAWSEGWHPVCDRVTVAVDADLGMALRIAAETDRVPWFTFDLTDVRLGARGPGVVGEENGEPIEMSAREAAAAAGFPVLLPARVPAGAATRVFLDGATVNLFVERPDDPWTIAVHEQHAGTTPEEDLEAWDRLEGLGRPAWIWDPTPDPSRGAPRWLVTVVGDTRCSLSSMLPRELLFEVAASLRPA